VPSSYSVPTVILEPNPNEHEARQAHAASREPLVVACPEGGALVDVCDAHGAAIPFACKSANCGACRIDVLAGPSELLPPARDELDVLQLVDALPHQRLACQAKMKPGLSALRVRAARDDS
jgi:ferredoxin